MDDSGPKPVPIVELYECPGGTKCTRHECVVNTRFACRLQQRDYDEWLSPDQDVVTPPPLPYEECDRYLWEPA